MGQFKKGDRIFDTYSGEFGTVVEYQYGLVRVEYDQNYGCDSSIDFSNENNLELAEKGIIHGTN